MLNFQHYICFFRDLWMFDVRTVFVVGLGNVSADGSQMVPTVQN